MIKKYYIYRVTNLINGKTYIGQHQYKDLNDNYMGSGKRLRAAQAKYGIENFKKEILVFNISKKEHINLLEKTFIAAEREKVGVENCYNLADGGEGGNTGPRSEEEIRKKLSEAHKGIKQSIEAREKRSRSVSEVLKVHRELYKHYKSTGGELNWNAFRKKMKEEEILGGC